MVGTEERSIEANRKINKFAKIVVSAIVLSFA